MSAPTPLLPEPTPADDLFLHQMVAPHGQVVTDQRWGERSFFSIPLGRDSLFEMGLRAYPQRGILEGYTVARKGDTQYNLRAARNLTFEDPMTISVGAIHGAVVRPGAEWNLRVDAPEHEIEAELTYVARTAAFYTDPMRVERDGQVLVHNLTYFQSGRYSGTVRLGRDEFTLDGSFGARDRSWGHRKRESAPARGLMSWIDVELPEGSAIIWLYEKADGTRAFTDGCWLAEDGSSRRIESVEHRYEFDPMSGALCGGSLLIDGREIEIEVANVVYMAGAGHVEGANRSGELVDGDVRGSSWDLSEPVTRARYRSVDDHLCDFTLGTERGYGIVEISRGTTAAYGDPPPREG